MKVNLPKTQMNELRIPYETRSDLRVFRRLRRGETYFVVADTLRNRHTELSEMEFFVLDALKQSATLSQLAEGLLHSFGAKFTEQQLLGYLDRLLTLNLLSRAGFGAGQDLFRQKKNEDRASLQRSIFGWLSIQLPGFYPKSVLKTLEPLGLLAFNRFSLMALAAATVFTIAFALLKFPTLFARIPNTGDLLAVDHIFMVVCAYVVVKVFHELGHGLACQRVGHECSEMGIIFLVFMPCLYCDVSDVWTQENKWKRIFVSAAGVIVEIAIAVACFWGWMFVADGKMAALLFSIMMITSFNTLLVNGNPLMRFDGYYMLSDYWEIPNLSSRASSLLRHHVTRFVSHNEAQLAEEKPQRQLAYAIAAVCYRWFIMISIGMAIWYFFDGFGLKAFGTVALAFLALTAVLPMLQGMSLMKMPSFRDLNIPGLAFLVTLIAVTGLILILPFSYRIWGLAELHLAEPQQVFAPSDGEFQPLVVDGQNVLPGEVLGKIVIKENDAIRAELKGELDEVLTMLKALEMYEQTAATASEQEFLNERRTNLTIKLSEFDRELNSLVLKAGSAGRFVAHRQFEPELVDLRSTELNPYSEVNKGAHVKRGALLGYVGIEDQMQGRFEVEEHEIELLQLGDTVKVHDTRSTWSGKITNVSLENTILKESNATNQPDSSENSKNVYLVTFDLKTQSEDATFAHRIGKKSCRVG